MKPSHTDNTRYWGIPRQFPKTHLTNSHVLRAILKAVSHAMPELEREATRLRALKRPSNARGKEALREEFEKKLAAAFVAGMRAAAVYE